MEKIWSFILYAFRCALNVLLSMAGKGDFSDKWVLEVIIGGITILIIILIFYFLFRITGLLKIEK